MVTDIGSRATPLLAAGSCGLSHVTLPANHHPHFTAYRPRLSPLLQALVRNLPLVALELSLEPIILCALLLQLLPKLGQAPCLHAAGC
eukprot:COSAG01_NODE_5859_length_3987_cov_80.637088_3_plen_88_part_00